MTYPVIRVSRAAFYAWRRAKPAEVESEARVRVHLRGLHRASRGTYGSPRVTAALRKQGVLVNHKGVARLMRAEGLQGLPRRRFSGSTTDSVHARPVAPNVLAQDFSAEAPNVAWVGDITYLPVASGWALDEHLRTERCLTALQRAVATRQPSVGLLHDSDRGAQYASVEAAEGLQRVGIFQSISRKSNCWDDAVAECLFRDARAGARRSRSMDERRSGTARGGSLDSGVLQRRVPTLDARLPKSRRVRDSSSGLDERGRLTPRWSINKGEGHWAVSIPLAG